MNKVQRKELERVASVIEELMNDLQEIADAEREKFENAPENLQCSERCAKLEEYADSLESIISDLDSAADSLRSDVIEYV